jgi:hypothetical protein
VADMGALFDSLTWDQISDDTAGVMQVCCWLAEVLTCQVPALAL